MGIVMISSFTPCGKAKVDDLDLIVLIDQDIVKLKVTVSYSS
jgi:hypothetical protein|tara:strand:- start:1643 stop:1768 length:126 start_codon:yes stop_codon:yes gene_type:complete